MGPSTPAYYDPNWVAWEWITADRLLSNSPCYLVSAHFQAAAAGVGNTSIVNGQDTGGEVVFTFVAAASTGRALDLKVPLWLSKGLFIDVGANTQGVLVQYHIPRGGIRLA